jgi:hypothetical protein
MAEKRKLPGIEVELFDKKIVVVREIRPKDLKLVLTAMPALRAIGDAFKNAEGQVTGLPVNLPDDLMEPCYPLLEKCTDIPIAELQENYSLGELTTFLNTFTRLLSKNMAPADLEKLNPVPPVSQAPSSDTPSE